MGKRGWMKRCVGFLLPVMFLTAAGGKGETESWSRFWETPPSAAVLVNENEVALAFAFKREGKSVFRLEIVSASTGETLRSLIEEEGEIGAVNSLLAVSDGGLLVVGSTPLRKGKTPPIYGVVVKFSPDLKREWTAALKSSSWLTAAAETEEKYYVCGVSSEDVSFGYYAEISREGEKLWERTETWFLTLSCAADPEGFFYVAGAQHSKSLRPHDVPYACKLHPFSRLPVGEVVEDVKDAYYTGIFPSSDGKRVVVVGKTGGGSAVKCFVQVLGAGMEPEEDEPVYLPEGFFAKSGTLSGESLFLCGTDYSRTGFPNAGVLKFSLKDGKVVARSIWGDDDETANFVLVLPDGWVLVGGSTETESLPENDGSLHDPEKGKGFLMKLSPDLKWKRN